MLELVANNNMFPGQLDWIVLERGIEEDRILASYMDKDIAERFVSVMNDKYVITKTFKRDCIAVKKGMKFTETMRFVHNLDAIRWAAEVNNIDCVDYYVETVVDPIGNEIYNIKTAGKL